MTEGGRAVTEEIGVGGDGQWQTAVVAGLGEDLDLLKQKMSKLH